MALENPAKLTLVLGGARSGKSRYAEGLVTAYPAPWRYLATAQSFDAEMADRIAEHRGRRSAGWETIDAPLNLLAALQSGPSHQPMLVDCLTLWLTNIMLADKPVTAEIDQLVDGLKDLPGPCVMVSNEVGLGIVPDNALARVFRDHAGRLHQKISAIADRVVFVVAGLPMMVKP
ncbi:MAG: bifunctional adenosylcobinamide kinase/adenosylcobinamide-phosphate guanylyltransferase [Hyphomicrobium sp.]|nr:bifunctional adenosylcobinamide kinase/adenosylcobinamide-phosphate guanylyltransferase [Hyphomicrobium sp.]